MSLIRRRSIIRNAFVAGVLLLGIFSIDKAQASELSESWVSARSMGMGNAFTAVASEGEALFYNPAALARVSGFHWTIMDPRLGLNGPEALEVAEIAGNSSSVADKLNDLYGKAVWVGGGGKSSIVFPGFGFAAYANGDVGINLQNPAYPQLNLNYFFDYGLAFGGAFDLVPSIWSVGMTARRVNRTGTNLPLGPSVLATLDLEQIKDRLKDRGTGYGLDLGTMLTLPSPIRPTLAFTIRNFGTTSFSFEEGTRSPPPTLPDMTFGASFTIDTPILSITPAFDYRYIDRADIQTGKKLHLGVEFELPLLTLRAGLNQGYYTAGAGLDLGVLEVEAATYGVELGEYPGQLEDRRYIVQMKIQLGLDGDLFDFSKMSGDSGRRKKLKQRR